MNFKGERVAVFSMDPGTTTGYTEGIYDLASEGSSFEIVAEGILKAGQILCRRELEGAEEIAKRFLKFSAEANMEGIPLPNIWFAYEDFVLYPGREHSSARTGISPARVTSAVQGMLIKYDVNYSKAMAGLAKQKATMERLKRAGIWFPGKPHACDAVRHAVLTVSLALTSKLQRADL